MYYEYWGLKTPPFDNVPDPTMYAECHASMENAIAETLFAIEEGKECIAIIVGDVGLGKTMSIRIIIDSLDQEKYKIALITNPSTTFVQILREIIGQIKGRQCEEKRKVDLLEIFNKLLFETLDEGKKVLIFIDESNAIAPANLESLRLLTNMQDDQRNLFTIVLVGQMELARRLEHPKRANLFQRIGMYNRIDKIQTEDLVKAYVETRLRLAGGTRKIFTDDVFNSIWKYSEHGIPRLINKICKLSLKAGETNELAEINKGVVNHVGERFQKMTRPAIQKRRPRKRLKKEILHESIKEMEHVTKEIESITENWNPSELSTTFKGGESEKEEILENNTEVTNEPIIEKSVFKELSIPSETSTFTMEEDSAEVKIGEYSVRINFPSHLNQQAQTSTQENRVKLAGAMAAQTLKENPQLTEAPAADPVYIWDKIRDFILNRIEQKHSVV
ncbi:MAG: ExeA family protein [Candidatus Scalinduaceae bacterium]